MECTFYLAEGCNLQCKYCYEGKQKKNRKMDNEVVEQALEFLVKNVSDNEKIQLTLLGGEPLLNKSAFFHVIDTIHNKYGNIRDKFFIEMTTNGILLDESVMRTIKDEKINLSISIDGDKDSTEINRKSIDGEDKFPIIMKNINRMIDMDVLFNVRMTVSNNNVQQLYNNIGFFLSMEVQKIYISYDYYADWTEEELFILDKQMRKLDELYLNEIANTKNCILSLYDFKYTTFFSKRPIEFCSAGSNGHFVVNTTGDIFPCNYVANREFWNIGNLNEGIDKNIFKERVKRHVKKEFSCKTCEIAFTCLAARCGFLNYRTTGVLNQPGEIPCKLERILYKHDLWVFQELYSRKAPRIMKYIDIAKKYKIEPNECVKNMFV